MFQKAKTNPQYVRGIWFNTQLLKLQNSTGITSNTGEIIADFCMKTGVTPESKLFGIRKNFNINLDWKMLAKKSEIWILS